jgi:hypothetical protein
MVAVNSVRSRRWLLVVVLYVIVIQTPISHGRRTTISDIPVSEAWSSHAPFVDTIMNRGSLVGVGNLLISTFSERYEATRWLNGIAVSLWAAKWATLTRKIRFPAPQTRLSSGDSIRPATISVKGTKLTFTNLASGGCGARFATHHSTEGRQLSDTVRR